MLVNPPPDRCESCGRVTHAGSGFGIAAGDPGAWLPLEGPETNLTLDNGITVTRRGRGWVCRACGHTVPASREFAR
ncbi:MAG: hypothetical protein E6J14_12870 [Chloroflexi bacterium]|nr:MAG: hypothetical protein E6J14_12870 [Chloroflexota bacterium]